MLEFNIEAAKAGAKLITRDGHPLRIVCYDRVDEKKHGHILGLMLGKEKVYEMAIPYDNLGHNLGSYDHNLDIMLEDGK